MDSTERLALKELAVRQRLLKRGHNRCDLCNLREGTDYHEIISRGRTEGAPEEVRDLSYSPELCALVCPPCHDNIAPTTGGRMLLLASQIDLYGYDAVEEKFNRIPYKFRVNIALPPKEIDLD